LSYEELERLVIQEYDRIIDKAMERYGAFTPPKIYIPRLHEEEWKRQLLPEENSAKFYGTIFFGSEKTFFAINTWVFLREMEVFGREYIRKKLRLTLCHELVHFLREDLPEIEINVEAERLLQSIG